MDTLIRKLALLNLAPFYIFIETIILPLNSNTNWYSSQIIVVIENTINKVDLAILESNAIKSQVLSESKSIRIAAQVCGIASIGW